MTADYDTIVIGSGFGGSVTAYRLAEAGRRVCLLERGRAYPPGSFPRSPERMQRNFWDPSEGMYGLFSLWSFSGLGAIVSSGLGGGSLIYANVLLRKDERWFVREEPGATRHEFWPVTRQDLDPHYDRAEAMLGATRYPFDHEPFASTPRTRQFTDAAQRLGLDWQLPPLAVTFGNPGERPQPGVLIEEGEHRNLHGQPRFACRLVGECDIGCNFGSKNSLDNNYLSEAIRHGLELRTLHEVRALRPSNAGWAVDYVAHSLSREGRRMNTHDATELPVHTITADRVVLASGTLGSTFLLLSAAPLLPALSRRLGQGFSGNGDLLGFAMRSSQVHGRSSSPRVIDGARGPVITAAIRLADSVDGGAGRGAYIEDAGYPEFVNWMLEVVDAPGALFQWLALMRNVFARWLGPRPDSDMSAQVSRLLGSTALSSGLLPLLGMGRDTPDGVMHLVDGKLEVDWSVERSRAYFERVRAEMKQIAEELGASFVDNPTWHSGRVITVHPLGGCSMGRTPDEGVVDAWGRVFGYDGLYVADGAVMPGPVGANPSLTIAALADRFADGMLGELGDDVMPAQVALPLEERLVPFIAGDGLPANLINVKASPEPPKGPVLLIHGAGVRANIFRAPVAESIVDFLARTGYDVWLENWRASIDLAPNQWTLDQAAVFDHPVAVRTILAETGHEQMKAVVHCQGSTSFMMSAVAGLVPQVTTVVSNAVSLHPIVPQLSRIKLRVAIPVLRRLTAYFNPHWGDDAPTLFARCVNLFVALTHHECDNPVCKQVSVTYGSGFPALWRHENLNDETHEWLRNEFGHVPLTFFDQIARCVDRGHLVSVDRNRLLPEDFVSREPATDARFAFLAGAKNLCFLPESQRRSFDLLDRRRPGYHSLHIFPRYGHLDVFMGKNAARDTFPMIAHELERRQ